MSKNVSLMGADYPDVPAVILPQTGGGSATFTDVSETTASQNDVLSGKVFFNSSGQQQNGSLITHNVYDGLDSSSSVDALSANQGKILNESKQNILDLGIMATDANTVDVGCCLADADTLNMPTSSGRCVLFTVKTNYNDYEFAIQFAASHDLGKRYMRYRWGSWSYWQEI